MASSQYFLNLTEITSFTNFFPVFFLKQLLDDFVEFLLQKKKIATSWNQ